MWFFPSGAFNILFGTGINTESSDIGFVQLIHMVGINGLLLSISAYIYLYVVLIILKRPLNFYKKTCETVLVKMSILYFHIIILNFITNFKGLLFFRDKTLH